MFIFIPFSFAPFFVQTNVANFPHHKFSEFLAGLLSICCMIFLGFADDVLDLRWRHKMLLPSMATAPLLMVYYVNDSSTTVMVPLFLRDHLGTNVDIGIL